MLYKTIWPSFFTFSPLKAAAPCNFIHKTIALSFANNFIYFICVLFSKHFSNGTVSWFHLTWSFRK